MDMRQVLSVVVNLVIMTVSVLIGIFISVVMALSFSWIIVIVTLIVFLGGMIVLERKGNFIYKTIVKGTMFFILGIGLGISLKIFPASPQTIGLTLLIFGFMSVVGTLSPKTFANKRLFFWLRLLLIPIAILVTLLVFFPSNSPQAQLVRKIIDWSFVFVLSMNIGRMWDKEEDLTEVFILGDSLIILILLISIFR